MAAKSGKLGAVYEGSTSMSSTGAGQRLAMVRNWTISESVNTIDVTSFDSSGYRDHIDEGHKTWTGTAEKLWTSGGSTVNFTDWCGTTQFVRLFVQWTSTPKAAKPAIYYYGKVKTVTGMNINTPLDGAITQDVTFQGCSNLQLAVISSSSDAWSSTTP